MYSGCRHFFKECIIQAKIFNFNDVYDRYKIFDIKLITSFLNNIIIFEFHNTDLHANSVILLNFIK